MDLQGLLLIAREASQKASAAILEIYDSGNFSIDSKADNSPLTIADKTGHEIILSCLEKTGISILSEEGEHMPFEERMGLEYLWIVDPLDGTKEFIKRNGEFTVNIALVKNGVPILGVVGAPVLNKQYFGITGVGAWVKSLDSITTLEKRTPFDDSVSGLKVVASRSHLNQETSDFLAGLKEPEIVSMGSSLKFMMIAEGKADIYPRFAPTMEWDTAAAHAIVKSLNGNVVDSNNRPLLYNKENLQNPYFRVF